MANIGLVLGGMVGTFVTLIVGLNLYDEVIDEVTTLQSNAGIPNFIATDVLLGILPTVVIIGLLVAGATIGALIGRSAQMKVGR